MAESGLAKTAALLDSTDQLIGEVKRLQEEILPKRYLALKTKIRINKTAANIFLLTAHVSLRDKIAYEQQRCAIKRQMTVLEEIEDQRKKWAMVLSKAKEQKKQLKRLQKVQQENEVTSRFPNCNEEHKAGLEKRIATATARTTRAQYTYRAIMTQLKDDTVRMEDSKWHRRQEELDEKAWKRAAEAVKKSNRTKPKNQKVKVKYEKVKAKEVKTEEKVEDWLPPQYQAKGKENQRLKTNRKAGH